MAYRMIVLTPQVRAGINRKGDVNIEVWTPDFADPKSTMEEIMIPATAIENVTNFLREVNDGMYMTNPDTKYGQNAWHCDDILRTANAPVCVLDFIRAARNPNIISADYPPLFATYQTFRVRVVMASPLGFVGITPHLLETSDYELRVFIPDLTNFSTTPEFPSPAST